MAPLVTTRDLVALAAAAMVEADLRCLPVVLMHLMVVLDLLLVQLLPVNLLLVNLLVPTVAHLNVVAAGMAPKHLFLLKVDTEASLLRFSVVATAARLPAAGLLMVSRDSSPTVMLLRPRVHITAPTILAVITVQAPRLLTHSQSLMPLHPRPTERQFLLIRPIRPSLSLSLLIRPIRPSLSLSL